MQKNSLLSYLPSLVAIIAVGLLASVFEHQSRVQAQHDVKSQVVDRADTLRARLQSQIDGGIHLSRGLASILSRTQDITQAEFSRIVSEIFTDLPEVVNIAWAPDMVITRVHPVKGNEQAIGLDFRTVPDQFDAVVKARDTGQIVLVGPVDLVQGGKGFIFRVPVYASGEDTVRFKGLLSLVFDMNAFLAKSGMSDPGIGIEVAMAVDHGRFGPVDMIHGPLDLATDTSIVEQVLVPGGNWTLFARPAGGWKAAQRPPLTDLLLLIVVCLLILVPMVTANALAVSRKATIQKMDTTARHLKGVMENVPGAYITYKMFPDGSQIIDFISDRCIEIWGLDRDTVMKEQTTIWDTINRDDLPGLQAEIDRAAKTLTPWHFKWRITTPAGEEKWLEGRGSLTAQPDGTMRRDSFVVDITEQHKRDEEFERQAELVRQAQKQESIGLMTGGVAHDFNNLLAVVRGSLELLRDDLEDEDVEDDDRLSLVATAIQAADRGSDLTKSMLSFARRARLNPEVVDLNEVVQETKAWAGRTLPATIDVRVDLAMLLPRIWVDRGSTASALLNLIVNARDALPKGGQLTISTALEKLDAQALKRHGDDIDPGAYVVLTISDSGEGISKANMDRIFEPFFSTKHPGKGSGLGLSMVQGFVKQSGGTIRVTSEPGKGTTFKLYFKALDGKKATSGRADGSRVSGPVPGLRILLAEDDEGVRTILTATLERLNHKVAAARNGDTALELFGKDPGFDLLITDIVMPGDLQGTDLAREIRQIDKTLPVIFLSGYARDADAIGGEVDPMEIRLMKPVRRKVLAEAIERALAARKARWGSVS
ncbi:ATP-binding protein [Thalassovita aquimarina]|uniref:histidine kinase n=1 Tax=Thalassovita aquimarina TaxID=2785917 RepID=A0ABS5HTR4_9RHOB|nr:ATP-binding protein [Thalassovita aquimarina]MBR9652298.1 CHASE domain-containing protein [Thalassovita aquimarina]